MILKLIENIYTLTPKMHKAAQKPKYSCKKMSDAEVLVFNTFLRDIKWNSKKDSRSNCTEEILNILPERLEEILSPPLKIGPSLAEEERISDFDTNLYIEGEGFPTKKQKVITIKDSQQMW